MTGGYKLIAVVVAAFSLTGCHVERCLGTIAVGGSGLSAAVSAGCHQATLDARANQSKAKELCGSYFK